MRATQALHIAANGNDRPLSHIDPYLSERPQISSREALRAKIALLYREVVYAKNNNLTLVKGKKDEGLPD